VKRDPNARLEDRLGPREPPYRSRGESQVGRLLERYGIPFCYEHPLVVYSGGRYRSWHPDFTLPTYGDLIVEYAGMPDRADYMIGLRYKQRVYALNHVAAVFIYPQDVTGPSWPERLASRIHDAGVRNLARQSRHAYSRSRSYR